MSRRAYALVLSLLVLLLTIFSWVSKESGKASEGFERVASQRAAKVKEGSWDRAVSVEEAERVSPPGWRPPLVFQKEGRAVVSREYPRGENERRRFKEARLRQIAATTVPREPVVLARMPGDGRTHLLVDEVDFHTKVGRRLAFDPGALDAVVNGEASEILVPSVHQEILGLVIDQIKTRDERTHTLSGRVRGEEETSVVQLVYHDGILHGSVVRQEIGQELEYRILSDGFLMVREIDQKSMTDVCGGSSLVADELGGTFDPGEGGEGVPSGDTAGNRVLDLVVGYGREARIADGGISQIEARIIASVDRMNLAFVNSEIANAEVMLLGTIEDPDYDFPGTNAGSMLEELGDLRSTSDGVLDSISDYRAELGADFVAFVLSQADGSAGIAYRPGRESITSRTYMTGTRITFAHELGHNIGCDHSWGDSSQAMKRDYGWRLDPPNTTRVRTIMAYDWGWGNRIPYFGNPDVFYNGARTGAVPGYDVRGDATADQRYAMGGLGYSGSNTGLAGFDGTNANLAAMNAETIASGNGSTSFGMSRASSRSTRTNFNVVSPTAGDEWAVETPQSIFFTGGDMEDRATIALFQGGNLVLTIAGNLNPATDRRVDWTIPDTVPPGSDYLIRVTLDRNGGQEIANSGLFEITGNSSQVVSHSPPATALVVDPVLSLKLTFNRPMAPGSFSVADDVLSFSGPGGVNLKPAITGGTWTNTDTTLTLSFPALSQAGSYALVLGPQILDLEGSPLDQDLDSQAGEAIDDRYQATFEISSLGAAVDAPGLVWTSAGAATWFPQKQMVHDGVDAVQSGDISNNETSSVETVVQGPGTLSFWWKIDSETNYDFLEFYLNEDLQGGEVERISGNVDWVRHSVVIPVGAQTLRWTYRKDQSVSNGADAAWIDEVTYTPDDLEIYVVSFRGNENTGGSVPPDDSYPFGFSLSLPGNNGGLNRDGFSFAGWNTLANGEGTNYQPGAFLLMVADLVLFAEWNALPEVSAGLDQTVSLSSGGEWSPALLNPEAWYDAGDTDSLLLSDGAVSQWLDRSGNGRHATQTDAGARPGYEPTAMNGGGGVEFDGTSSFLNVDLDYLASESHSAFVVTSTTAYSNIYGAANPGQGANSLHIGFRNSSSYRTNYWGNDWYGTISFNFDRNGGNVLNFVWQQNVGKEIFANGWSEGTRSVAGVIETMSGGGRIGRVTNHGYYGGEISEMLFYTGDLAVENRELVEGYLAHKWSLEARLPDDHPYKVSGPNGASVAVVLEGTADDNDLDPLTAEWTQVSGPGGVRFDDPFQLNPVVTFTAPGTYVLLLTVTDGFGERSDEVTITVGEETIYERWAGGSFVNPFVAQGLLANPDDDGYGNLQEFAFGMDPTDGSPSTIDYTLNGGVASNGPPMMEDLSTGPGEEFHVIFTRRKDYQVAELTYLVEFTADLTSWTVSSVTPVTMTDPGTPGEIEVVAVPFPEIVPLAAGGSAAPLYYRVGVSTPE